MLRKQYRPMYSAARYPEITARPGLSGTCVKRFKSLIWCNVLLQSVEIRVYIIEYLTSFYGSTIC